MKTIILGEAKRKVVRQVIDETLLKKKVLLVPTSISCSENLSNTHTIANFSFDEIIDDSKKGISIKRFKGSGFVDCFFRGCLKQYSKEFQSLKNLALEAFSVNPKFSTTDSFGSDASIEVILNMKIKGREPVQFRNESRSILLSSYVNILSVFQFYINCEKSFCKLRSLTFEADQRSRGDISSEYKHKLSFLAEVNNYERR